jgi:LysR family transcriptional regulator, glycine cleavage system transcriptional activator
LRPLSKQVEARLLRFREVVSGAKLVRSDRTYSFDRSFLAIAMASSGLGVTLESTLLAGREIATGKLVAPLEGRSVDVCYVGHYLTFPRASRQRRAVRAFAEWITSELSLAKDRS